MLMVVVVKYILFQEIVLLTDIVCGGNFGLVRTEQCINGFGYVARSLAV